MTATFTLTNTGKRAGADVPQVNPTGVGETKRMRLLGFERVELQPGESKEQWRITGGTYDVALRSLSK